MPDTLTITDNRTGRSYEVAIDHGTIRAADLRAIKTGDGDSGLMTYDPALVNTAACKSRITYIDGDKGILRYRGYPIDQLAEESTYLETVRLLLDGELPTAAELAAFTREIEAERTPPRGFEDLFAGFPAERYPMGVLASCFAALSNFYPDSRQIFDQRARRLNMYRAIGHAPTIAAYAYRQRRGLPIVQPSSELGFVQNFLAMLFSEQGKTYQPHPVLAHALDVLFILHADHEQNCSTFSARAIGSSHADLFSVLGGAVAALSGPLHGGANEAVLRMLTEIDHVSQVPELIKHVKAGEGRLMGFGHRVYKSYDPRAKIIKRTADEVFEVTGKNPLLEIALELERIALQDDYFVSRKLYPNVDFYSGLIYQAMGFPTDMFPVLFAIPRVTGWLAQWEESLLDADARIVRPRQIYLGADKRDYVPVASRR
jgi:citrate synthase